MSKVEFLYSRSGKKVQMQRRYAETLRKLGHGTYETRMLIAAIPSAPEEPLIAESVAEFAKENGVDIGQVTGTGKDGRIKKSDVEAFIAVQV